MDGFKINQSLQFKLSAWLSAAILAMALAAGIFSFFSAFAEAIEFQDDQLRQVAALINRHALPAEASDTQEIVPDTDPDSQLLIQVLPTTQSSAQNPNSLPSNLNDGMQTLAIGDQVWRVFVRTLDDNIRIAVGQQTAVRDEIARYSALRTMMPFILVIPMLFFLLGNLIRKMFKPLKQLAIELDHRAEHELGQVSDHNLPSEIRPFVVAINRLLARIAASVALQRRFIADAAHELRSPMTALSLQAERLADADMSAQARERLTTLRSGVQRARTLLHQMLMLAHAQEVNDKSITPTSLWQAVRVVLEDLMPLVEAKRIDLGVIEKTDAMVCVAQMDLHVMIKNLIENAIRYTPIGGTINIAVHSTANLATLQIDDSGIGIPEHERERVFDPFYRLLGSENEGSGLGLAIVKAIALRTGVIISCSSSDLIGQ